VKYYDWHEHCLMVSIRNRAQSMVFLTRYASQEDVFEQYLRVYGEQVERGRYKQITDISVMSISEEVYDMMESSYTNEFKVEGD
jgi:hypothetical protein